MSVETEDTVLIGNEATRFQAGNPGRPKGARNKLGEAFILALQEDFAEHGKVAIIKVRETKPDAYLKVIASLMPKEIKFDVGDDRSELTDEQLIDRIRALTAAVAPLLPVGIGGVEATIGETKAGRVH